MDTFHGLMFWILFWIILGPIILPIMIALGMLWMVFFGLFQLGHFIIHGRVSHWPKKATR